MPDDQASKEPVIDQSTEPVLEEIESAQELTPEPVAESALENQPAEPVEGESTKEIQPAAKASAEAEENPLVEAPLVEPAPPETAQSENEPFSEAESTPPQEQPSAVPVAEILIEPDPAPAPPPTTQTPVHPFANFTARAREMLVKARAAIQSRKRKKLEKILVLLDEKKNIANDDVEKLLRVSDATATRYLNQLEKEGKIIQVGKTGKAVRYVRSS